VKNIVFILVLVVRLLNPTSTFADKAAEDRSNQLPERTKTDIAGEIKTEPVLFLSKKNSYPGQVFPLNLEDIKARFYLARVNPRTFYIPLSSEKMVLSDYTKNYSKPVLEISKINLIVWAFDRYVLDGIWAKISFRSISENFKNGYTWDYDDFGTNHFGHAYHGAMYHSAARFHGLNFAEATLYTALGSFMWEFFWESEQPGKNDTIMSTLGGVTLGEVLFRITDLIKDESSSGLTRALRKSLRFLINPTVGFKEFTGEIFQPGDLSGDHLYSFRLPFGAYRSSDNVSSLFLATQLEYRDVFQKNPLEIRPYDWFTFEARLRLDDGGLRDPEIFTSGILLGKKMKNSLAGLFGLFDYIDTHMTKKMSVVGVGPGFVTSSVSESNLVFNSTGILSFIFGGSSASIDFENPNFDKESHGPYHFGPGILGRVKLELGLKSLGSIHTGFSRYWVHSLFADANEFMSIISFDFNYDLSRNSRICLGCDYYLRSANYEDRRFAVKKNAVRAVYVLNF